MHFPIREVHFFYEMETGEIIKYLEEWAPPGAAWNGDNVGLQIGSRRSKTKAIFICLELNKKTLEEAIQKNCNFIFTHHPFIFKPLKKIELSTDNQTALIEDIIKNDICLYSAHTNLDFTKDGVNYELAKILGLKNVDFLDHQKGNQVKLVVFVPNSHLTLVSEAVFSAGGGIIGEYNKCSYSLDGQGTFEGSENSFPAIGQKQKFEKIEEIRLEVLVNNWQLQKVITAIIKAHPYEEPAFDIYPLQNRNVNYGSGAIGELEKALSINDFLALVNKNLKTEQVRYCKGKKQKVKRIAVSGGSISDSLQAALKVGADALVTADVKYHTFQEAENQILLVDAGHYETEIHSLKAVKEKITKFMRSQNVILPVHIAAASTNPTRIYKH